MRFLFPVGLVLNFFPVLAQRSIPSAQEVLNPVYARAAREGKNVLLIFRASWCGWCRKMEASLSDAGVKPLIDKSYAVAHLTVQESKDKKALENGGAQAMLEGLGGAEQGLPYWAVLDAKGKTLFNSQYQPGENTGCPASKKEVAYFIDVLHKTSKLNTAELEIISDRMRKNEQ